MLHAGDLIARTLCVLVSRPGSIPEEVWVTFAPGHRVADLAGALAGFLAEPGPFRLAVDGGPPIDPSRAVEDSGIRHGDHLLLVDEGRQPPRRPAGGLELRVLTGAAAGLRLPVADGRHALGRGSDCDLRVLDPSVSRSPAWLLVRGRDVLVERIETRQDVRIDGRPVAAPARLPLGRPFEMGGAVLMVADAPAELPARPRGSARGHGHGRVQPGRRPSLTLPAPPPPVSRFVRLGLAGWARRRRAERFRLQVEEALRPLPGLLAEEAARRRAAVPDPCDLADRARLGLPALWERGRADPDFLRLGLGRGSLPSEIGIERPAGGDQELVAETLRSLLPPTPSVHGVPLTVDLVRDRVLAVPGQMADSAGLARWLVVQAACLHGPAELAIAAALTSEDGWDWLRWLPHASPAGLESAARLVASGDAAERLIAWVSSVVEERRDRRAAGRALLVIVDDACAGADPLLHQVLDVPDCGVHLLVVGPGEPAAAPAVARVVPARNELRLRLGSSEVEQPGVPDQVSLSLAGGIARDLAGIAGPDGRAPGLLHVLGARDGAVPMAERIAARWDSGAETLDAVLGLAGGEPVEVDLRSGPHALVTGMLEAGRRELLIAWIAGLAFGHSPRWLNVLLLDATGGAGWEDLGGLPHAVGPPPGAGEDAIVEVLSSLVAEAARRRLLLAGLGERDVGHLRGRRPDLTPACLLVVLDGYDRLVATHPEAGGPLAELAGLSPGLGIHLLIGAHGGPMTLPAAIRARTGIRVELGARGQRDRTVIATASTPGPPPAGGAGVLTVGRGMSAPFQAADPGCVSGDGSGAVLVQRPGAEGATDLARLVRATREAAGRLGLAAQELAWRPKPTSVAAAAPDPAAGLRSTRRRRVEVRLTVESPPRHERDVAVEMDPERTVADLVASLTSGLGLDVSAAAGVYHRRRQAWLRPDQTVRSVRLRAGDRLVLASRSSRIQDAGAPAVPPGETEARLDDQGHIAVNRPPRPSPTAPDLQLRLEAPPERGQGSWRALVPVGTGIVMGLMMGGTMYLASGPGRQPAMLLLSVGMTPLMALLTGIMPLHDVWRRRRDFRRAARAWSARIEGLGSEIDGLRAAEAAHLRDGSPDTATLVERARTLDPALWERRPTSPDWLHLRIGLADTRSSVEVALAAGGEKDLRAAAERRIGVGPALLEAPMVLPLAEVGVAGLYGDRSAVSALARWLAVQVATLHSPEEVIVAAAVPARERPRWAWLGWLPHVHSRAAALPGPRVVSGGAAARGLLQRLLALVEERRRTASSMRTDAGEARAAVVAFLHEDAELPRGQVSRLLEQGPPHGVHAVWMASRRNDLPGECGAEVGLHASEAEAWPEMHLLAAARSVQGRAADGVTVELCADVARGLAPLRDLSARSGRAAVPEHVELLELLRMREDVTDGVRRHWARARGAGERRLEAPIGAGAGGAEFSLDLGADGPHLLVEGGANSGKSELLRSLVASLAIAQPPSALSFLLIDHEGQGTFEACAALPHTVSVVTFLDAGGARRVLAALRSELSGRENVLRETGAKDLATLERGQPEAAPPRLVVVIDEFARLAADVPDFMAGMLDLAQHGSRLGVHLVLATQRPAGVSRAIADSTRLRVLLRASETGGERDAAVARPDLPPGRAFVRAGAEAAAELQIAFTGGHTALERAPDEIVVRELEFGGTPAAARLRPDVPPARGDTDLRRVARAIEAAAARLDPSPSPAVLSELADDAGRGEVAVSSIALTDLLGIDDIRALDVGALWRPRPLADRLRVPTGLTSLGSPMMMDLKEAAVGGAGPHGLIIGTSGSGKSEMLRTLVTSLAVTHPPEILAFVFIDFKGGAAFAGLSELPHVAGMITNLQDDLSLIDRMQAAITGERNRRQELLRRAGNVDKLSEYQRKREAGEPLEPLPYLMLIVDEFGELLTARPDFVNLFAMVGRVGRSLGIHLLFSSQQFEEGRLRGLEDNLGYRIALRTASPMASRTVLGVPDAFELPKEPGWGYYKFGPTDMVRFRAALVSQPCAPPADGSPADAPTMLDVAVAQLRDRARPVHQIWLPPLEVGLSLDRVLGEIEPAPGRGLAATSSGGGQLRAPVGLVDKPAEQKQDVMTVDLTGHLLVVGAAQTGKSTLLRTMIASAALTHTPREAQFYCIDYSGGTLRTMAGLPHVGGICGRGDPERVRRTVEEVAGLIGRREALFQQLEIDSPQVMRARRAAGELTDMADVFLVIDNWIGLRQEFPELEDTIRDVIAARGPGYGVHLVLSASRWMEVRDALRSAIGGRLELRLTEPAESAIDTRAAKSLSDSGKQFEKRVEELRQLNNVSPKFEKLFGRGITAGGLHFQAALPRIDGRTEILDLQQATESLVDAVAAAWSGPAAPPIRVLPRSIRLDQLPASAAGEPGVPIAISERDLGPVHLDLVGGDPHFLVFGDVESGKSTLLRTFLTGLLARSTPDEAQVLIVDYRRSLLGLVPPEYLLAQCSSEAAARESLALVAGSLERRLPGPDVPVDRLRSRSWWKSQAEVYVVVDDYDLVASAGGGPLQALYPLLPQSRDLAFHLVIARSSGGAGQGIMEPVLRRLRELRTPGLLMSGEPQEGAILGGHRLTPLPPGRGRLIRRREGATFVQVVLS